MHINKNEDRMQQMTKMLIYGSIYSETGRRINKKCRGERI